MDVHRLFIHIFSQAGNIKKAPEHELNLDEEKTIIQENEAFEIWLI